MSATMPYPHLLDVPVTQVTSQQDPLKDIVVALLSPRRQPKVNLLEAYLVKLAPQQLARLVDRIQGEVEPQYREDALCQLYVLLIDRGLCAGFWRHQGPRWSQQRREWDRVASQIIPLVDIGSLSYAMMASYDLPTFLRHVWHCREPIRFSFKPEDSPLRKIGLLSLLVFYNILCVGFIINGFDILIVIGLVAMLAELIYQSAFRLLPALVLGKAHLQAGIDGFKQRWIEPLTLEPLVEIGPCRSLTMAYLVIPVLVLSLPLMLWDALQYTVLRSTTFDVHQPLGRWVNWLFNSYYPQMILFSMGLSLSIAFVPVLAPWLGFMLYTPTLAMTVMVLSIVKQYFFERYPEVQAWLPNDDLRVTTTEVSDHPQQAGDGKEPLVKAALVQADEACQQLPSMGEHIAASLRSAAQTPYCIFGKGPDVTWLKTSYFLGGAPKPGDAENCLVSPVVAAVAPAPG